MLLKVSLIIEASNLVLFSRSMGKLIKIKFYLDSSVDKKTNFIN